MSPKVITFRTERWVTAICLVFTLISLGVGIFFYHDNGFDIWTTCYVVMFILGIAGTVDCFVSKAILSEDSLTIVALQGRDSYPRAEIESVIAEKGCPIILKMQDGSMVKLTKGGASVNANSLRNWLRKKQ